MPFPSPPGLLLPSSLPPLDARSDSTRRRPRCDSAGAQNYMEQAVAIMTNNEAKTRQRPTGWAAAPFAAVAKLESTRAVGFDGIVGISDTGLSDRRRRGCWQRKRVMLLISAAPGNSRDVFVKRESMRTNEYSMAHGL